MSEVQTGPPRTRHRGRNPFGNWVAERVTELLNRYHRRESGAIATLARLRRELNAEPGIELAFSGIDPLPAELLGRAPSDEPTRFETAFHTALTLFAFHQQSQATHRMHVNGPSFATQVAALASDSPSVEAVRRRFAAAGTASSYAELRHHTRGLVAQLRAKSIGMDYGLFADDLAVFLGPDGPAHLRGLWGRDFWRNKPSKQDQTTDDSQEQQ